MDDDDEVDDNLFIEFSKYTNYDLIRTIRKSFMGAKIFIDFEDVYKSIKVPSDMINLMTAYFITGIFISKYVYTKMFSILKQLDCNFLKLNIYEDQPYFYLMTNFTRNFIFINCYYHYIINPSGLIQASSYDRTIKDALRILEILNKIVITLKKNKCYNVSPEFMLMNLLHLIWVHDRHNKYCKILHEKFNELNWNQIKKTSFKNKLKCGLFKNYLSFLLLSYLVKPFLKI